MNKTVYYKYRSLEKFDRVLDILVNNRIYASRFDKLNDPMEGYYHHTGIYKDIINDIYGEKVKTKICSLSKKADDLLFWAYYADSQHGVCIGVKLNKKPTKVSYKGLKEVQLNENFNLEETVKNIFERKCKEWKHEQEYRILTNNEYIEVEIVELIIGNKTTEENQNRLIKYIKDNHLNIVIKKFNPYEKTFEKIYPSKKNQ